MKNSTLFICLFYLAVFNYSVTAQAFTQPDYNLAYLLSVVSYCSYTVTELEVDHGQSRAQRCLTAAARSDRGRLDSLDVGLKDVEAYYDLRSPENAYLLVRAKNGVILAFRGSLAPPVNPDGNIFEITKKTAETYNVKVSKGFYTFVSDWLNNARVWGNALKRHRGFDDAWQGLLRQLKRHECTTFENCSKFKSFIDGLDNLKGENLYITGHSKGGALATLATLDIPNNFHGVTPVTYIFSAAKSLTAVGAKNVALYTRAIWRFERVDDLVPSVPPDRTFKLWTLIGGPAYAHVGALALFDGITASPKISLQPSNGEYEPSDGNRISKFFLNMSAGTFTTTAAEIGMSMKNADLGRAFATLININSAACTKFIDNHFAVFSDVRVLAVAGDGKESTLFIKSLADDQGRILWGYSDWCNLLKLVK